MEWNLQCWDGANMNTFTSSWRSAAGGTHIGEHCVVKPPITPKGEIRRINRI